MLHPHRHCYTDVIRRERQYILLLKDSFSTFSSAMIIGSEKAEDLKAGLIILTNNVRHPGPIAVTTHSAVGFASLEKGDKHLADLDITIKLGMSLIKTTMPWWTLPVGSRRGKSGNSHQRQLLSHKLSWCRPYFS